MKLPPTCLDLDKVIHSYSHFTDIDFSNTDADTDISILTGADNSMFHLYTDIRVGNEYEPVAHGTKLGGVILGGRQNNNKYPNISTFSNEFDLGNMVSKFWQIESYGVSEKQNANILPQTEQRALNILEKTTTNTDNRYTVGLLWDDGNVELPDNKNLALSRFFSLETKYKNHPTIEPSYMNTMQEYTFQGHASKLSKTKAKQTTLTTNYLPCHPVKNINKPDKIRIVFDAGAKTKNASLNTHLLKGPDFLNNLVGVLLKFRQRKYAVMDNITQIFHQV